MSLSPDKDKLLAKNLKRADKACRGIESALKIALDDELIAFGVDAWEDCSPEVKLTAYIRIPSWDVEQTYDTGTFTDSYIPEVQEIMDGAWQLLAWFILEHMVSDDLRASLLYPLGYVKEQ